MDSGWKTWRASVRTKCNSMQTQIDNAADAAALETLFTYTTTDGVTSRPLGEFPVRSNIMSITILGANSASEI